MIVQRCGVLQPNQSEEGVRNTETSMAMDPTIRVKIEEENERLRRTIVKLNERLGDEIVSDSDDNESIPDEFEIDVNTRHYEYDSQFASEYRFITDVSTPVEKCT